jgi:RNA polymerase sigma factor (TIGR02999 family)
MSDVTQLLEKIAVGKDPHAHDELLSLIYNELHAIAESKMAHESGHTLQPTALINEAWPRLFPEGQNPKFQGRAHFFAAAAAAMRRTLVDHARRKMAGKRGRRVELSESQFVEIASPVPSEEVLAVHEALEQFAVVDPTTIALVELRFFVGFTAAEAAAALGMSERTADRHLDYFKAWFKREFRKGLNI